MNKKQTEEYLEKRKEELFALSDEIWEHPEIAFQEYRSMDTLCSVLEREGFRVEKGLADIPTAFKGTFGEGKPTIGILGEFDALDGMSQEAGVCEKKPITGQSYGHGCGHHGIASAAVFAAAGVKKYLEENHLPGTVVFYGCPGEEGGSGKSFMVRDGVFEGTDCAVTWHPADQNALFTGRCLANISATYHFHGIAAHAAGLAYIGRSALDAVELMNVGANFLREHVVPDARIHYAITDAGGKSPNVVQAQASVFYYMRAPRPDQVVDIYHRIEDIAKGAALMTGTTVESVYNRGVNSLMPNGTLNHIMQQNMEEIPLPVYGPEDYAMADRFRKSISGKDVTFEELLAPMNKKEREQVAGHRGESIYAFVAPEIEAEPLLFGSTDVGDVSMFCPVAQLHAAAYAAGTALHSWQAVAQGKSRLYHEGELYAAKVLAGTVIDLFENPERIREAKEELKERLAGTEEVELLPKWVKPQLKR